MPILTAKTMSTLFDHVAQWVDNVDHLSFATTNTMICDYETLSRLFDIAMVDVRTREIVSSVLTVPDFESRLASCSNGDSDERLARDHNHDSRDRPCPGCASVIRESLKVKLCLFLSHPAFAGAPTNPDLSTATVALRWLASRPSTQTSTRHRQTRPLIVVSETDAAPPTPIPAGLGPSKDWKRALHEDLNKLPPHNTN